MAQDKYVYVKTEKEDAKEKFSKYETGGSTNVAGSHALVSHTAYIFY
jgi:hypothetical protein